MVDGRSKLTTASVDDIENLHKALERKLSRLRAMLDELEASGKTKLKMQYWNSGVERVRLRERASRSCLERLVSSRSRRDLSSAWHRLSDHFEVLYDTPETLAHLRQSILQLAVQGKLVPQDPNDEPADALIEEIYTQKQKLVEVREIAKPKKLPKIDPNKLPFDVPNGWKWIRLESVCEVITKGSSPKWQGVSYVDNPEDGVLFITSENVGVYLVRAVVS